MTSSSYESSRIKVIIFMGLVMLLAGVFIVGQFRDFHQYKTEREADLLRKVHEYQNNHEENTK